MDINFYSTIKSKLLFTVEASYIHPYLIMADTVLYSSMSSDALILYEHMEIIPEKLLMALYLSVEKSKGDADETVKEAHSIMAEAIRFRNKKHKDRNALLFLGRYKTFMNSLKKLMKLYYGEHLDRHRLTEMLPFHKDDIWILKMAGMDGNPRLENHLIPELVETITEREAMLSLDESVDTLFKYTMIDSDDIKKCDFIKIPLWRFPPNVLTTYEQLKYTRDSLKPTFEPFNNKLKELSAQLFDINFEPGNIHKMKQLCREALLSFVSPIQTSINESLYMAKMINNFPEDSYLKFCLGIAPVHTLINYYEKNTIVESYVTNEIKEQIARHINMNATYVFSYFEMHGGNPEVEPQIT